MHFIHIRMKLSQLSKDEKRDCPKLRYLMRIMSDCSRPANMREVYETCKINGTLLFLKRRAVSIRLSYTRYSVLPFRDILSPAG